MSIISIATAISNHSIIYRELLGLFKSRIGIDDYQTCIDKINDFLIKLTNAKELIKLLKKELDQGTKRRSDNTNDNDDNEKVPPLSSTALGLAAVIIDDLEGAMGMIQLIAFYLQRKIRNANNNNDNNNNNDDIGQLNRILDLIILLFNRHVNIINIKKSSLLSSFFGYNPSLSVPLKSSDRFYQFVVQLEKKFNGSIQKYRSHDKYLLQTKIIRDYLNKSHININNMELNDLETILNIDGYNNIIIADEWKQLDNLIENNDPCSICQELFTEAECKDQNNTEKHMVTPSVCNHRYHRHCLLGVLEWSKRSSQPLLCPLCRTPFHEITTIRV